MRLALSSVDSFPKLGGISTMTHHLANAFVQLGHEVVLVGPKGSHVPREHVRDYGLVEDWESRVERRSGEAGLDEDRRIADLFDRVIARYGAERVLLMHPFYYGIGALDAAHAADVPCSVYFHGFELRSQLGGAYPRRHRELVEQRRITTLRERVFYLVGASDEILVNSRYTASLFDPFELKPRVRHTGCGIPGDVFERERDLTPVYDPGVKRHRRRELGLPEQTCMAYVGRLVRTKRVDRLIALCRQRAELGAVLVGEGPDEARLRELVDSAGVADRVSFRGRVREQEKWDLLRAADFLCLLSEPDEEAGQVEGFGIALLEGAAAGAVPVSSGTGGMGDVVDHRHTGLVVPPDDRGASEAVSRAAADEAEMQALVEGARMQIARWYTWPAVAERIAGGWSH